MKQLKKAITFLVCLGIIFFSTYSYAENTKFKVDLTLTTVGFGELSIKGNVTGNFKRAEEIDNFTLIFKRLSNQAQNRYQTQNVSGAFVDIINLPQRIVNRYINLFDKLAELELFSNRKNPLFGVIIGNFTSSSNDFLCTAFDGFLEKDLKPGKYDLKLRGVNSAGTNPDEAILKAAGKVTVSRIVN